MLEILTIRFWRQNGIALPCNQIIDVLVEAQTGFLACLKLFIHINSHTFVWHLERRSQAFADGSNRHEDCIFHYLAISCSEDLVVITVVELKRIECREVWHLLAHRIHFREVVFVSPIQIGFDNQLTVGFAITSHILQRIGFHSSVRQIDMKGFGETRHYRRIWIVARVRTWIVSFEGEEVTFVPTVPPTSSVSSKHVRSITEVPIVFRIVNTLHAISPVITLDDVPVLRTVIRSLRCNSHILIVLIQTVISKDQVLACSFIAESVARPCIRNNPIGIGCLALAVGNVINVRVNTMI